MDLYVPDFQKKSLYVCFQPSDARVGPRKAANSHNIPCCPTLSEATICQTKLEGIPQKDAVV